jgi:polysaccharide export outer membrane protein
MNFSKYLIIFSAIVIVALSSCSSRKQTLYIQNPDGDSSLVFNSVKYQHIVTSGDILYINFYSFNKALSEIFNNKDFKNTYSMWNSLSNIYVNGFSVGDSGNVQLPLIGKVNIKDLTLNQAEQVIQEKARTFVSDVTVTIKLLNYRYSVVGEVNHPGTFTNYNDNLTIFHAIAAAVDVTIYGNKTKSSIIRETENGKVIIPFDFTKIDVLSSEVYYIKPNDIIYIEPSKNKIFRQNLPNIALLFSSISTTILVLNYMGK